MNWEIISNQHSSLQEYRLIDNSDCKMILKYNPLHKSARITSANNHRLFFLESTGAFGDRTIFRNEYGMEVGNLVFDKLRNKEGSIIMDEKKYHYQINNWELLVYKTDPGQPLISCTINTPAPASFGANPFANSLSAIDTSCIVIGLCWYLALQVNDGMREYAN